MKKKRGGKVVDRRRAQKETRRLPNLGSTLQAPWLLLGLSVFYNKGRLTRITFGKVTDGHTGLLIQHEPDMSVYEAL